MTILHEGWLLKGTGKASDASQSKSAYFQLLSSSLKWFDDELCLGPPSGSVPTHKMTVTSLPSTTPGSWSFEIISIVQRMVLEASSEAQRDEWVVQLQKACVAQAASGAAPAAGAGATADEAASSSGAGSACCAPSAPDDDSELGRARRLLREHQAYTEEARRVDYGFGARAYMDFARVASLVSLNARVCGKLREELLHSKATQNALRREVATLREQARKQREKHERECASLKQQLAEAQQISQPGHTHQQAQPTQQLSQQQQQQSHQQQQSPTQQQQQAHSQHSQHSQPASQPSQPSPQQPHTSPSRQAGRNTYKSPPGVPPHIYIQSKSGSLEMKPSPSSSKGGLFAMCCPARSPPPEQDMARAYELNQ